MQLDIYQLDAFTNQIFRGNPAAVVPVKQWLPEQLMQDIAMENNLSETAFIVPEQEGYGIRWFTPKAEVDLCDHATLASAFVIFNYLNHNDEAIQFHSNSGPLQAVRRDKYIQLDFPAIAPDEEAILTPEAIASASNQPVKNVYSSKQDYLAVLDSADGLRNLIVDYSALETLDKRGVIFTARGEDCDFVSRCFFPKYNVDEDPVTGSAHCVSAPYWGRVLQKNKLHAKQLSQRGGEIICELRGDRVLLLGQAVPFFEGKVKLEL